MGPVPLGPEPLPKAPQTCPTRGHGGSTEVELLDINPTEKYHPSKDSAITCCRSSYKGLASGYDGPCFELCMLCRPEARGQQVVSSSVFSIGMSCLEVLPSSF